MSLTGEEGEASLLKKKARTVHLEKKNTVVMEELPVAHDHAM
jgi:hypothetical protein